MNQANDSVPCRLDCADCASERRLFLLAGKLNNVGLQCQFDTCDSKTRPGHYDSVIAINPSLPERGALHIDSDGEIVWQYDIAKLDGDSIGKAVDEAINVLRPNGLPRRQKVF